MDLLDLYEGTPESKKGNLQKVENNGMKTRLRPIHFFDTSSGWSDLLYLLAGAAPGLE